MTNLKFELTSEFKTFFRVKLFRIKALIDFSNVKKDELGGFIEKENNLDTSGNAWVYGDARVSGDAWVYGDARVSGDAQVYGNAQVSGDARVSGDAQVYGNAQVYGDARVSGNAWVSGNARVYGNAQVYGDAWVSGNAQIKLQNKVLTGYINKKSDSIEYQLAIQLGVLPVKNKIILYKRVNKVSEGKYKSLQDSNFIYEDNKISEVKDYDKSDTSCSRGIHLSNPLYWNEGDTLISCEVNVKDIITIQEGKVRCKKCKCLGEIKL